MRNKLRAFTINEMMVALVVTVIVVLLAFSVLTLIRNQMTGIERSLYRSNQIDRLRQSLWMDMNRLSEVSYESLYQKLSLANEVDTLSYIFTDSLIIKGLDTFRIKTSNIIFFFDGNQVHEGDVDGILINTGQEQQIFVYKRNDAKLYLD